MGNDGDGLEDVNDHVHGDGAGEDLDGDEKGGGDDNVEEGGGHIHRADRVAGEASDFKVRSRETRVYVPRRRKGWRWRGKK